MKSRKERNFGDRNKMFLKIFAVITFLSANMFAQEQERTINKMSWKDEPVKIIELKTKNKTVELDKRFSEKEDWWKGITATVKNISDKPISRIELDLSFIRPEGTSEEIPTYGVSMIYGRDPLEVLDNERQKEILPGESVDIRLLEVNLPSIKTDLKKLGYPEKITRTRILVRSVTFNDGTMWDGGDIFYPHPTDPKRKYNPHRPLPETLKAPPDQSALSCNSCIILPKCQLSPHDYANIKQYNYFGKVRNAGR